MPRPRHVRCVAAGFPVRLFKPAGIPGRDLPSVTLTFDEMEALRLVDADGLYQDAAARQMGISRPTLSRVLNEGRRKTAQALSQGWALALEPGPSEVRPGGLPMIVAIPVEGTSIAGHWGHTPQIALYQVENRQPRASKILTVGEGCACKSGLAQTLHEQSVTHVVVGQIGGGAYQALQRFGMTVFRGVTGPAQDAALALAEGRLNDLPELCHHEDCDTHAPAADLHRPR